MSEIELISFDICPFVQRSLITLHHKNVPHKITFIDLADKPDWFLKISPFGKVPVLRQGEDILFESAVINEYLDETQGTPLHPQDPMARAKNRAWIEFGSSLLGAQFGLFMSPDEATWQAKREDLQGKLQQMEEQVAGPFFNGPEFSLVDTAIAPLLMRFALVTRLTGIDFYEGTPKIAAWSKVALEMDAVQKSVIEDFEERFVAYFKNKDTHLSKLL